MYRVQDRETGCLIDSFDNYEDALAALKAYEGIDLKEGNFTPDFYEVVNCQKLIPINNGGVVKVVPTESGIKISTTFQYKEDSYEISDGDFISMLNWYVYQKNSGNSDLTF